MKTLALLLLPLSLAAGEWLPNLEPAACQYASRGSHPYFKLEPGHTLQYESKDGAALVITVLERTRVVDGVETRVVEERESENGALKEVSYNYMALCKETGDLMYFGEDVDIYEGGKVKSHDGAWLAGKDGAKAGILLPGKPAKKQRYYQEQAPGVAMDRAEVLSVKEKFKTPAGKFTDCLKTLESTPLEPKSKDKKIYAPGIGLLKDGELLLVRHGMGPGK